MTLVVGAGSPAGGIGVPSARQPVHLTATATVAGSASGSLGLLTPLDGSADFVVNITGEIGKPPLSTTVKMKVTLRGSLRAPIPFIQPPGNRYPPIKRMSLIMPTPVLDANGLPT